MKAVIKRKIKRFLEDAASNSQTNPIYSLLLCRMAAEAIIADTHRSNISQGEPKDIVTIGDIRQLGLTSEFSKTTNASFTYIQQITNPFLHFQYSDMHSQNADEKLVERVISSVQDILDDIEGKRKKINVSAHTIDDQLDIFFEAPQNQPIIKKAMSNFLDPSSFEGIMSKQNPSHSKKGKEVCICGETKPGTGKKGSKGSVKQKVIDNWNKKHAICKQELLDGYVVEIERITEEGGDEFIRNGVKMILLSCKASIDTNPDNIDEESGRPMFTNEVIRSIGNITDFSPFTMARFWMFLFKRNHPNIMLKWPWDFDSF